MDGADAAHAAARMVRRPPPSVHFCNNLRRYVQTPTNDLLYWGLDYPPLTAYHSRLCAQLLHLFAPESVALFTSRGHESVSSKILMRLTVVITDALVLFPAALLSSRLLWADTSAWAVFASTASLLLNPALIVIDHGHFQYNGVMAAFAVLSVAFLYKAHVGRAAAAAAAAVLFKQMALLLAPYWLAAGLSLVVHALRSQGRAAALRVVMRAAAGAGAVLVPALAPFYATGTLSDVFTRVFPVTRGLYEDKVATVWCALSPVFKLQVRPAFSTLFAQKPPPPPPSLTFTQVMIPDKSAQAIICAACALIAAAPALISFSRSRCAPQHAVRNAFAAVAAAFLFGYQMHEKTVLLPLVILSLAYPLHPTSVLCVTITSMLSMFDLIRRDGHASTYAVALFLLIIAASCTLPARASHRAALAATVCAVLLLHAVQQLRPPPAKYPWLYPYLASLMSCLRQGCAAQPAAPALLLTRCTSAPAHPLHQRSCSLARSLSWSVLDAHWRALRAASAAATGKQKLA